MGLLSTVSSWATLPVLGGVICLYFIVDRLVVYLKFRHIPGPWWTGLSSSPHSKHIMGPRVHEWYAELSEKYGPIVRIAPGIVVTSSPDLWTHVNKNPAYKRTDWYYHACRVEYRRDNVFTQTDNAKHDARRKQMAPGYSGRENLDLEPTIDARLNDLLTLIRTKYLSTESHIIPMDLAKKVQYFTLDVISDVGLGKTFGMLTADADVDGYLQSAEQGLTAASFALAFGLSWLAQAPVIGRFLAPSPTDDNGFGRMIAACYRDVDARAARETDKRSDMLAKETYGEDAKTFRPERWFEENEEKLAAMKSVNDLVFGYGKFLCLGKPVAQIELAKTIFELFRNFELAPMDPARPWKAYNAMGLFFISDMWVQVMERK
ncbi:Cytochrome P450 monooxygenase lolP1 [Colletotrichum sp. SAR 10_77]|nr:Cytochrome P450 monooxygenase lolP1 [Colletotrichum sp. SAR 10_77]